MSYKLIVFDLDGTLIDTAEDVSVCLQATLQNDGYGFYEIDSIKAELGLPFYDIVKNLIKRDMNADEVSALINNFRSRYNSFDKVNTRPFDGISDLLTDLQNENIHIGVNTNKQTSAAKDILKEMFPNINYFLSGHEEGINPKPSSAGVNIIMRETETLNASDLLYVGDTSVDMLTASNVGCDFVLVNWTNQNCALKDDSRVKYYCENIEQLRKIIKTNE